MSAHAGRHRSAVLVCLLLACCAAAPCQEETVRITGEVVAEGGGSLSALTAELCEPLGDHVVERALVAPTGKFTFEGVAPGQYTVRITAWRGEVLGQQLVAAAQSPSPLEIQLKASIAPRPAKGTVSLAELDHRVPRQATKELEREERAFHEGDIQTSIKHLRKALEIDPRYMQAHNNLGARYMALNRFEDAAAEFRTATELDPAASKALANLAGAELSLKHYGDAEAAARRAVEADHGSSAGHYLLGQALYAEGKKDEEAAREFERAAAGIPVARLAAATVFVRLGSPKEAAGQLRLYLSTDSPRLRSEAQAWLAEVEGK